MKIPKLINSLNLIKTNMKISFSTIKDHLNRAVRDSVELLAEMIKYMESIKCKKEEILVRMKNGT